jgi:hypothetical protein
MLSCTDAKNPRSISVVAVRRRRWMSHQQQQILDYLREENRILHAQLGTRRVRFDDEQRRRLAVRAKLLGRRVLAEVATIVTPDTLLRMAS